MLQYIALALISGLLLVATLGSWYITKQAVEDN